MNPYEFGTVYDLGPDELEDLMIRYTPEGKVLAGVCRQHGVPNYNLSISASSLLGYLIKAGIMLVCSDANGKPWPFLSCDEQMICGSRIMPMQRIDPLSGLGLKGGVGPTPTNRIVHMDYVDLRYAQILWIPANALLFSWGNTDLWCIVV